MIDALREDFVEMPYS
jgi:phosphatidylinositol glycan class O